MSKIFQKSFSVVKFRAVASIFVHAVDKTNNLESFSKHPDELLLFWKQVVIGMRDNVIELETCCQNNEENNNGTNSEHDSV